jgi:16S rRNA (cytidine1402-2'-O)-methyltransferase
VSHSRRISSNRTARRPGSKQPGSLMYPDPPPNRSGTGLEEETPVPSGRLYLVSTPIGNLEDITLRALRILRTADRILAEDTRRTRQLCAHYEITTPLVSVHEHNITDRIPWLLEELAAGKQLALVTDAGMPVISDPGMPLIRSAVEHGIAVEVLPGPSAVVTAVAGSGFPGDRFVFAGFPPRSGGARRAWLEDISTEERTVAFYESPFRIGRTLADMALVIQPEREVVVTRELTKLHETYHRGTLASLVAEFQDRTVRGEITVVVAGMPPRPRRPEPDDGLPVHPHLPRRP